MSDFKTYTLTKRRGIDDLLNEYPWQTSKVVFQGDEAYYSVSLTRPSKESDYLFGEVPQDPEAIEAEIKRRKQENARYIEELKVSGEYGSDYNVSLVLMHHPLFDEQEYPVVLSSSTLLINFNYEEAKD